VTGRIEQSAVGRLLIDVVLLVSLLAIVVVNLPASQLKQDLARLTAPYVRATGLDQNWAVFSNPRTISAYVYGVVDFADGSSTTIGIPAASGFWAAFVDYRWQKYEEIIRPDDGAAYWPDYARYLAAQVRDGDHEPVRVSLVRRWSESNPPGPGPDRAAWQEATFYALTLGAGG
jgi:hypothetical protein